MTIALIVLGSLLAYGTCGFLVARELARKVPDEVDTGSLFIFFSVVWPIPAFIGGCSMICKSLDGYVKKQNNYKNLKQQKKSGISA